MSVKTRLQRLERVIGAGMPCPVCGHYPDDPPEVRVIKGESAEMPPACPGCGRCPLVIWIREVPPGGKNE